MMELAFNTKDGKLIIDLPIPIEVEIVKEQKKDEV